MSLNNEPIRILNLFTILNRGGAETMVMNYYRNIDRNKVQFDFLVHREERGVYEDEIESLGGRIYRMPPIKINTIPEYRRQLRSFFKAHPEYRIIHSHMSELGLFAFIEAKKQGVQTRICHAHSSPKYFDIKMLARNLMKKLMLPYVTDMFTCGVEAGIWLYGEKNRNDLILMKNAIDAEKYRFSREKQRIKKEELGIPGKRIIGHVGSFLPVKNQTFLVDVFCEICKEEDDTVLMLVGSGSEFEKIQEKIKNLGFEDKVMLMGSRSDVHELMQAMDIFVFPSTYEGLPVTLIEAQASGLPCIVSDRIPKECKITDLLEFYSLDKTPNEWAKTIVKTFGEKEKTDVYRQVCTAGYDIKENAEWLQNFYVRAYEERKQRIE